MLGRQLKDGRWDGSHLPDAFIIGVPDARCPESLFSEAPDRVREHLYHLKTFNASFRIVDLGNVKCGNTPADSMAAVKIVAEEIASLGVPLLILGGDQLFTVPLVKGLENPQVHLSLVDDRLDDNHPEEDCRLDTFINHLPSGTNVNLLAAQSFFISADEKENFQTSYNGSLITLGTIREGIEEMEPLLRETDMVSFDLGSMKASEAPGQLRNSPNGLTGEEACQLAWYAGISTKPCWFALFGYSPQQDPENLGAMMCAQIGWYFLNGIDKRTDDIPLDEAIDFAHYVVPVEGLPEPVTFLKHPVTKRWWMEVPSPDCDLFPLRIPCSKGDYKRACKNEIPERWWNYFDKNC